MWQIEDLIRAHHFDLQVIYEQYVLDLKIDDELKEEVKLWYKSKVNQMKIEHVENYGHLQEVKSAIFELTYLHNTLLNIVKDKEYKALFEKSLPFIAEFKNLAELKCGEIEICLNGMYAKFLLRLQKKEISKETEQAFESYRTVLSYLSKRYKESIAGEVVPHYN